MSETVGDALKVGSDAAQEATRIGIKAVGAAPEILERKVKFAQGLGKTIEESTGHVRQVFYNFRIIFYVLQVRRTKR